MAWKKKCRDFTSVVVQELMRLENMMTEKCLVEDLVVEYFGCAIMEEMQSVDVRWYEEPTSVHRIKRIWCLGRPPRNVKFNMIEVRFCRRISVQRRRRELEKRGGSQLAVR